MNEEQNAGSEDIAESGGEKSKKVAGGRSTLAGESSRQGRTNPVSIAGQLVRRSAASRVSSGSLKQAQ